MIRIPCKVSGKFGYSFLHFGVDYIVPPGEFPWNYNGEYPVKTYAFVEDRYGNVLKVKPEKVSFIKRGERRNTKIIDV